MESKKKLNILILSWRGPHHPNAGGAEISTHEHAKGWVKAGYNVTLFTSSFRNAKQEETLDGIKIIRRGYYAFGVQWEAFKWYFFEAHEDFDLVIDQFHGIPFFTPIYIRKKKLAFIHEVAKEAWILNSWPRPFNLIPAILGTLFESLLFKIFYKDVIFMTVSESTKKDLVEWAIPQKNIFVIYNGITVHKQIGVQKQPKKTLIFLGALSRDKGIEQALEVFSLLHEPYKNDINFWVVGRGEEKYLSFLKKKAIDLGLQNIKFWGYVNETEKFKLLAKAHILINTSAREGWGLVVIEAAAMGTPSVAFDVAGLRDSIRDNQTGFISKERTVEDLSNKVRFLLDDEVFYQKIRQNAINWSKKFSWEKSIKESLSLINRIMD